MPRSREIRLRFLLQFGFCALCVLAMVAGCSGGSSNHGGTARLEISEVMASNKNFRVLDGAGDTVFDDWIEIHNPGSAAVNLTGYSITNNPNHPKRYEFPIGTVLGPNAYLVVFLFSEQHCELKCVEKCIAGCKDDAPCKEACELDRAACRANCTPPKGYVADINFSASGETIYLYGDGGRFLVDRVGVKAQADDRSNGIDPATGEYGVMYIPTPRAPNKPINLKMHIFASQPSAGSRDCDQEIQVRFSIERDLAAPGELQVSFQWEDVARCSEPLDEHRLTEGRVVEEVPEGGDVIITDTDRADLEGNAVSAERIRRSYVAFLPPAPCGTRRKYRVTASDTAGTLLREACVPIGVPPAAVVVNEYQPKNGKVGGIEFTHKDKDTGEVKTVTPDWIEIFNHGEEEVDISSLGLITAGFTPDPAKPGSYLVVSGGLKEGLFDTWLFGKQGQTSTLGPKQFLSVLADGDKGDSRKEFHLKDPSVGDPSRIFFSTHFKLDANNKGTDKKPFDGFALVDSATHDVLDLVVLDFSKNPETPLDIKDNQSVGRFPRVEGNVPGALHPGTITNCPTFEAENKESSQCNLDVAPRFREVVTIESSSSVRCPAAGEPVTVRARFDADSDSSLVDGQIEVGMPLLIDGGASTGVLPELRKTPAADQSTALLGATLYEIEAIVPGLPAGALVEFAFRITDKRLEPALGARATAVHDQAAAPAVSFRYLVGFQKPPSSPRLNEVLPGSNQPDFPPPFDGVTQDMAEIFNPSSEPLDLSGFYLTTTPLPLPPATDDPLIERARRFRFPDGTIVPPGAFQPVFFGPPPTDSQIHGYIEVKGFNLKCDGEILYLIAPDEKERGGNCAVDSIRWNLVFFDDQGAAQCKEDRAVGRVCDGCDAPKCVVELSRPTPGTSNHEASVKPMLVNDVFHQAIIPQGPRNGCPGTDASVQLNAIVFVDKVLKDVFGPAGKFSSASFFVDRGTGNGEVELPVRQLGGEFRSCKGTGLVNDCADPPDGYVIGNLSVLLTPPLGPVVRYRVRVVDACGAVVEAGTLSFGTTAGEHPLVMINEVNRLFAVPGDPGQVERPWIELSNLSAAEVNVSGMSISDNIANPRKTKLPDGTRIPAHGHLVVLTNGEQVPGLPRIDLSWTRDTGTLFLLDSFERGSCTLDSIEFDFADSLSSDSLGRSPDGTGAFVKLDSPSPGASNGQAGSTFVRGDANEDSIVNITDMVRSLSILFGEDSRRPKCEDALDADDNGVINVTDPLFIGNFLFRHGPAIPPPFPSPGADPTPDSMASCGS